MRRLLVLLLLLICGAGQSLAGQYLLIPMDLTQRNHLRAYGVAFHTLQAGDKVNWLLNYRGGSFLLDDTPRARMDARLLGVGVLTIGESEVAEIRRTVGQENMDEVLLKNHHALPFTARPTSSPGMMR